MKNLTFHRLLQILIISVFVAVTAQNSIADDSLEAQVVNILAEEAANGKIKVGILDFAVTVVGTETGLSKDELKDLGTHTSEELAAEIMKGIKSNGLKGKVSLVERDRLMGILEEKKLQASGLTEKQATNIGGIAGLDMIILGGIRITGDTASYIAKVINVKDGEILGIAKQTEDISEGEEEAAPAPAPAPAQPQRLLDESFTVYASTHKPFSWKFNAPVALDINLSATSNVDIFIMDETSYWKYKAGESVYPVAIKKDVLSSSFEAQIPQAGTFYIVISNRAILTPANVSLQVYY